MSFNNEKFSKLDFALGKSNSNFINIFNYFDQTTDTYADIIASGFFDSLYKFFKKGDYIIVEGTDDRNIMAVSSEAGVKPVTVVPILDASIIPDNSISTAKLQDLAVTTAKLQDLAVTIAKLQDLAVTTAKLAADAVDNTKLADDAVSLENLDSGITPVSIIFYSAIVQTVGGNAVEAFAVAGVTTADRVVAQISAEGTVARTILSATITTPGSVTVEFNDDPSGDHYVHLLVTRVAS